MVAAAVAVAVRALAAFQGFGRDALRPALDGAYYLDWAGDVARGDVLGRAGTIHGDPFLFNPLYAYAIAPLVGVFGKSPVAVVAFQSILAGATAALAAATARRFAGRAASWIAGLATALSAVLVHLDLQVAVSGIAAFLVAGACFACAPTEKDGERGHGPIAAGLWLGLSALARPVVLFALPFVAWLFARRGKTKLRAAALVLLPFAACAGISLARNAAVSGEWVVFTAANGQNLHLGNNPAARRAGAMATDEFTFGPTTMHQDARYRVSFETGRPATSSEVSAWFTRRAVADFQAAPGASLAWLWTKFRWFASSDELSSSYMFDADRRATPLMRLAFVPTWMLVAAAAAALVVSRKRSGLLLGPGSLALGHVAACTIVFPLSHYRSGSVPALAVMSAVAAVDVVAALRAGRGRAAVFALVVAVGVAVLGAMPPQARDYPPSAVLADQALAPLDRGDLDAADEMAARSLEGDPDDILALTIRVRVANLEQRYDDAWKLATHRLSLRTWDPHFRIDVGLADARRGKKEAAVREMDDVVNRYPWSGEVRSWRGVARLVWNDVGGAREDFLWAEEHGFTPPKWALDQAGIPPN